jgi:hypothetical protein
MTFSPDYFPVSRSRSLPYIKPLDYGRKSRNDSGVVLTDELFNTQTLSIIHNRRRIKSNQFVMHTSSHVCIQKTNHSMNSNHKHFKHYSCRFLWFVLFTILFLFVIYFSR